MNKITKELGNKNFEWNADYRDGIGRWMLLSAAGKQARTSSNSEEIALGKPAGYISPESSNAPIKKIGNEIFKWNPHGWHDGTGRWYTLTTTGKEGRVASGQEAKKLGNPDEEQPAVFKKNPRGIAEKEVKKPTPTSTVTDTKQTASTKIQSNKMSYQRAAKLRKTGLLSNINQSLAEGRGMASFGRGIGNTMQAKMMGVKETFDPMNMIKGLLGGGKIGNIAAGIYGTVRGRSTQDMQHFIGTGKGRRGDRISKDGSSYSHENGINGSPLYSTISDGQEQRLKSGEGIANVLARIYNLTKKNNEEEKLYFELEYNNKKEQQDEAQTRHKKSLVALGSVSKATATPIKSDESLLSKLMGLLPIIAGLLPVLAAFGMAVVATLAALALAAGIALAVKLAKNVKDYAEAFKDKVQEYIDDASEWLGKKFNNLVERRFPADKTWTPHQAANLLRQGNMSAINNAGGVKSLEDIVTGGSRRAQQLLLTGSPQEIKDAGGKDYLKNTISEAEQRGEAVLPSTREYTKESLAENRRIFNIGRRGEKPGTSGGVSTDDNWMDQLTPIGPKADARWSMIHALPSGSRLLATPPPTDRSVPDVAPVVVNSSKVVSVPAKPSILPGWLTVRNQEDSLDRAAFSCVRPL